MTFDKKVDALGDQETISTRQKTPAPLPELVQKVEGRSRRQLAANKKAASAYYLDHYNEHRAGAARRARRTAPIPAKLQPVAAEWDKFNEKDRELKKAVAEAKDAVEKEKRNVRALGRATSTTSRP